MPTSNVVPAPAPVPSSAPGAMQLFSAARAVAPAVPSGRGRGAGKGRGRGAGSAPVHQGGPVSPGLVSLGASSRGLPRGGRGKKGGRKSFSSQQAPQQALFSQPQSSFPQFPSQQLHQSHPVSTSAVHPPGPPPIDLAGSLFALGEWARQMGPYHPGGGAVPVPLATSSPVAAPVPRARLP